MLAWSRRDAGQARFGRRRKRLAPAASTYRIHSGAGQELLCAMEGEPGGHGDDKVNGSRNQSTAWEECGLRGVSIRKGEL